MYVVGQGSFEAAGSGNFHVEIHTVPGTVCVYVLMYFIPVQSYNGTLARQILPVPGTYVQVPYPL